MTATGQVEAVAVEAFTASRELFESVVGFLDSTEAGGLEHASWRPASRPGAVSCSASSCRITWTCGRSVSNACRG